MKNSDISNNYLLFFLKTPIVVPLMIWLVILMIFCDHHTNKSTWMRNHIEGTVALFDRLAPNVDLLRNTAILAVFAVIWILLIISVVILF